MLSLILVVVIVARIIYCIKKKKPIFSKKIFLSWKTVCIFLFILISYGGMITYIQTYDTGIQEINYYKNNIAQLETQIAKLEASIEKNKSNPELSKEESDKLSKELDNLNFQITINKDSLNQLPNVTPKRLSVYKFLLFLDINTRIVPQPSKG